MGSSYREIVEDVLTHGRHIMGHVTASFRTLPDFLVIGTQKGGTTSLFKYLVQHPHVAKMFRKEIHYFDLNFSRGIRWYKSFFPLNASRERHLKMTGQPLIAGEATPFYLFHPLIPGRVKEILPKIRLIALLRDPVERAFSHYHHLVGRRRETQSFQEVVEREIHWNSEDLRSIARSDSHHNTSDILRFGLVARGFYAEQLERWLLHFSRTQILIIKSDDLFSTPGSVVSEVYKFLELDSYKCQDFPVHNRGEYIDRMDARTRELLDRIYEPHNARLAELTGISF